MSEPVTTLDELVDHVQHTRPDGDPRAQLAQALRLAQQLDRVADDLVGHFVDRCRRAGISWTDIGGALGVTKQAAQKRYVRRDADDLLDGASLSGFSYAAQQVLTQADKQAGQRIGGPPSFTEHLVVALFHQRDSMAVQALEALGVHPDTTFRAYIKALQNAMRSEHASPGAQPFADVHDAIDQAGREAAALGHDSIGTEHLLLALLRDATGPVAQALAGFGVTCHAIERWVVAKLAAAPPPATS
jgi:hypothetical protein